MHHSHSQRCWCMCVCMQICVACTNTVWFIVDSSNWQAQQHRSRSHRVATLLISISRKSHPTNASFNAFCVRHFVSNSPSIHPRHQPLSHLGLRSLKLSFFARMCYSSTIVARMWYVWARERKANNSNMYTHFDVWKFILITCNGFSITFLIHSFMH